MARGFHQHPYSQNSMKLVEGTALAGPTWSKTCSRNLWNSRGHHPVHSNTCLTLERETIQVKDSLALKYAELVYVGKWFDPLRESIDAFMGKITASTTGSVTLKLYKGSITVTDRNSPYSLYRQDISSFENDQIYDRAHATGFIQIYGLPTRVRAMLEQGI